mgnify:CR=1 FL=1
MSILNKALSILLALICIGGFLGPNPGLAFDQPWDSGHNTTNTGGPGPGGPPGGSGGGSGGDPVNLAFGNLAFGEQDLLIPGLGFYLQILRFYNSQDRFNGPFGYGWHFVPFMNLVEVAKGSGERQVIVKRGDGVRLIFNDNGGGTYSATQGWYYFLEKKTDGYTLREKGGIVHAFDLSGKLLSSVDKNGHQLRFEYDGNGRLTSLKDATNRQIAFSYGSNGKISAITDFSGRVWRYLYDAKENLISVTDPLGNTRTYGYDSQNRLISVVDGAGVILLQNTYDSNHRVVTQTYRKGTFTFTYQNGSTTIRNRRGYDTVVNFNTLGNITKITAPSGATINYTYDDYARLLRVSDSDGDTDFTYDAYGNITSIKTPSGLTTSFTYENVRHQLSSFIDPMGHVTNYFYDAQGNLIKMTDPLGQETTYEYDSHGKLVKMTAPGGRETTFTHDANGYLTEITDTVGSNVYTVAIEYDAVGNVTKITRPGGSTIEAQWNVLNQLTRLTDNLFTPVRVYEYAYNAGNRMTKITENGSEKGFVYDDLRIVRIDFPGGRSVQYGYSNNDLIASVTDATGTTQYTYDNMDRVSGVTFPDATSLALTYTNDYLTRVQGGGKDVKYFYDQERRLIKIQDAITGTEYNFTYNNDGSRTAMIDPAAGTTTYHYDALDRLTSIDLPGGETKTFSSPIPRRTTTILNDIITAYNLNEMRRFFTLVTARGSGDVIANYTYEHPDIRYQAKTIPAAKRWSSWVAEEFTDNRGMYMVRSPLELLR